MRRTIKSLLTKATRLTKATMGLWFVLGTVTVVAAESATPDRAWLEESRAAAAEFASRLRTQLQVGLRQDPVTAINVCFEEAPKIAIEVGARYGFTLRRTSMRVRNPANAPSASDQRILTELAARVAAGNPVTEIEFIEDRGQQGRILAKPLITEGVCLVCHGTVLAPDVSAAIRLRYPQDAATGFDLGDLRGALLVESALHIRN